MKELIENILKDKKDSLIKLKLDIADDYGSEFFVDNSENIKFIDTKKSIKKFDTDVKNKFLEILKTKHQTTQVELNSKTSNFQNEKKHKIMLRFFRNSIIFKLFFPSLLYTIDLNNVQPKMANLLKDGSGLNKLAKTVLGIFCSWVVIYFVYFYLRYHLRINAEVAMPLLSAIFFIVLIGLSFNNPKFRCIVLLIVPFMATNRGRTIILMNCYRLSSISVLPTIFKNFEILLTSYECNKQALRAQTSKLVRRHNLFLRTVETINNIKNYSKKAKENLKETKRILKKSTDYVRKAAQTLKKIEELCSQIYQDLDQICHKLIDKFLRRCWSSISRDDVVKSIFVGIKVLFDVGKCTILYLIQSICYLMKGFAGIFPHFTIEIDSIFSFKNYDLWNLSIDELIDPLINQFDFEINMNQNISNKIEQNKNYEQIALNISAIYQKRLEFINSSISKFNIVFPLSFVFLLVGALIYHKKYIERNDFNNNILSVKFYEMNEKRCSNNLPSLLPLNDSLKQRYVSIFDWNLTNKERQVTIYSIGFLFFSLTPITFLIIMDKFMFSVNDFFRRNTDIKLDLSSPNKANHEVEGSGFMASTYRHLFHLIDSSNGEKSTFNNTECLPIPEIPNEEVHNRILFSIAILVLLTCFQSYIKRWRSVLAGFVYPERDRERAVWLFNHLLMLNSGMSFWSIQNANSKEVVKLNRFRRVGRFFIEKIYKISNFLYQISMNLMCCYCFGIIDRLTLLQMYYKHKGKFIKNYHKYRGRRYLNCTQCLKGGINHENYISCATIDCKGVYCIECFQVMDNKCKRCLISLINSPLMHELNEISFEKDSSDEENL